MQENGEKYSEIALVYDDNGELKIEKVYAERVGEYYQLKAIPAFANNVAYDDIISIEYEAGYLFFDELIQQSGHSVLHVVILKPDLSSNVYAALITFGVNINYLHNNLYLVIDVPPDVSYADLRRYLIKEREVGSIDVREACISDLHSESIDWGNR
jgi:hypothetical protein